MNIQTRRNLTVATFVAFVVATTVGTMTSPTPNSGNLDLPAAIQDVPISPVVMRIGVVTEIADADNITVKISGSNVLVTASYLFPQYGPVLGDRVVVYKQDAQWFVIGAMSGPINSAIRNPSFELGGIGIIPDGWSINVISTGGGTPTFTKVDTVEEPVAGRFVADFGTDAVAAGLSQAEVFSSSVPAAEDERWTAAYFIALASIDQGPGGISGGRFGVLELFVEFLDGAGTPVGEQLISTFGSNANVPAPLYKRPSVGSAYALAPPGTTQVRMKLVGTFDMSANSFTSFFLDYMILRQV